MSSTGTALSVCRFYNCLSESARLGRRRMPRTPLALVDASVWVSAILIPCSLATRVWEAYLDGR